MFRWDVGALPIGRAPRRGTGGGGTGWAIARPTRWDREAWEFLKYIAGPEGELDETRAGFTTPSLKSIVYGPHFLNPNLPPKNVRAFADAQKYVVVRDPVHVNWPRIQTEIVNVQLQDLWSNKRPAAEVARSIKEQADLLFREQ